MYDLHNHCSIVINFLFPPRPDISSDPEACIDIDEGRHPVIDLLKVGNEQFVPNSTHLAVRQLYLFKHGIFVGSEM